MIVVVDSGNRRQFAADISVMHRQRRAVFVDRAGWKVPVVADLEIDRYDLLEDTRYLLAKDEPHGPVLVGPPAHDYRAAPDAGSVFSLLSGRSSVRSDGLGGIPLLHGAGHSTSVPAARAALGDHPSKLIHLDVRRRDLERDAGHLDDRVEVGG